MSVLSRLSVMMFLQYAVWGAWLPIAARYLGAPTEEGGLGFAPGDIALILGIAGSVGAISSPFIAGQIADRFFATQRFLAVLLLLGGGINWLLAEQTTYAAWLWLSIAYSVVYMPTIALSNSMAFTHMADEQRDFPRVRLWGTIGWIVASWTFPMIWLQTGLTLDWMPPFLSGPEVSGVTGELSNALRYSALLSVVYALFCLTLPHTPPKRDATESLAFAKAFGLFKRPSFAVLVLASLLISTVHQIYFMQTAPFLSFLGLRDSDIMPAMTIGQGSEIVVMLLLGAMLKRLGFRIVLTIGAAAYLARYGLWGFTDLPVPVLVASQALHGVCFACFFASAFIYVDRIAPRDVRHSAQTVFGIMILGGGPVLAGVLLDDLSTRFTPAGGTLDYSSLWWTLAAIGGAAMLLVFAVFRDETQGEGDGGAAGGAVGEGAGGAAAALPVEAPDEIAP